MQIVCITRHLLFTVFSQQGVFMLSSFDARVVSRVILVICSDVRRVCLELGLLTIKDFFDD